MDLGQLAGDLTAFLAPVLPYLQQAGETVAGKAAEKLGEGVWSRAQALWAKLWPRVEAKESAREAVEDLARHPEDFRARGAVELQLEKILAADTGLAAELAKLLAAAGPRASWAHLVGNGAIAQGAGAVGAGQGGIAAGRDVVIGTPWSERTRGSSTLQRLVEFQTEFFRHAPPSETDVRLRQGDPDVEISEIAKRWCAAVAAKYDSAVLVYRQYRDTLPESSSRDLDKAVQKIQAGRGKWLNLAARPDVTIVGSDLRTAALEYHFHRIVSDAIEIEIRKERGLPRGAKAIEHLMDLSDIGRDEEA